MQHVRGQTGTGEIWISVFINFPEALIEILCKDLPPSIHWGFTIESTLTEPSLKENIA